MVSLSNPVVHDFLDFHQVGDTVPDPTIIPEGALAGPDKRDDDHVLVEH